ncbi:hypothetical protein ACJH7A_03785, partial [Mycobacterium sp. SMC-17]
APTRPEHLRPPQPRPRIPTTPGDLASTWAPAKIALAWAPDRLRDPAAIEALVEQLATVLR